MATLTFRLGSASTPPGTTTYKNAALTNTEIDANFNSLDTYKAEKASPTFTGTANFAAITASGAASFASISATGNYTTTNGNITSTNGVITAADFNSTSDARLKNSIEPVHNAVDIVKQLEGVSFKWNSTSNQSYGVIAQELEKVLPSLVNDGEAYKSVNYNGLIAFLINAIKELDERLQQVEK